MSTFSATWSAGGASEPDAAIIQMERAARSLRARNKLQRAANERWAMMTRESIDATELYQPYVDLLGRFGNDSLLRFGGYGWSATQAGSLAPLIRTEQDLNVLRLPSRITAWTNPYAMAITRVICNYAIGQGNTYTGDIENDSQYPGMKEAYQQLVDDHLEHNSWGANGVGEGEQLSIETDCVNRFIVDGEPFLREHRKSNGMTDIRILQPGQITMPVGGDPLAWSYGILTEKYDAQHPLAYNVRTSPSPEDDEKVSADDIIHIKNNVGRDCKRGIPDYVFGVLDSLRLAHTLRGNLGDAAAQQAAVVAVEQRETGTTADWGTDQADTNAITVNEPYSGTSRGYALVERGRTMEVPKGFQHLPGPGVASAAEKHLAVESMLIRSSIIKYQIPDWLITGDPSVANYATSLTVDSGFVKSMQSVQKQFRGPFRTSIQRAVEWRLRCMGRLPIRFVDPTSGRTITGGYDWKLVLRVASVKVVCQDPVSRDPMLFAQEQELLLRNGIQSRAGWAARAGTDINSVMRENEEYNARFPETGTPLSVPPGYGAEGGQGQ